MKRRVLGLGALALLSCLRTGRSVSSEPAMRPRWIALQPARERTPDAGVPTVPQCPAQAVYVGAATFQMGNDQGAPDERPQHAVTLPAYCIDRTEVTVEAYTRCVTEGACARPSGAQTNPIHPVTGIDWEQASSYCRFVGGRLPSEAEWELAARGTDGRTYPWGNAAPSGCEQLDWTNAEGPCRGVGPSPVGSSPSGASPCGANDMAGNVWEWTNDWYAPTYGTAPIAGNNPTGPSQGSARVTRGGGWNNDQPERLRTTWREGQHPSFHDYDLGVRCAYAPGR